MDYTTKHTTDSGSPALARFAACLVAVLAQVGCTLLPVGGGVTSAPGGEPSPMRADLNEYRAVIHCHSYLSHDSDGAIEDIAASAAGLGLNAVLLSDHYEEGNVEACPRGLFDGVLIVPGIEMRYPAGGSLVVLGPKRDYSKEQSYEERKAQFLEDGAVLIAGHVERLKDDADLTGLHGFEIYNLHAEYNAASKCGIAARFFFLPPDLFFECGMAPPTLQLERWDRELKTHRLLPVSAHDAHENINVFGPLGGTIGTYPELFRLFSTRILAPELTEKAILAALREGHVYVAFDWIGDPAGFSMTYGASGEVAAIPGDEVELDASRQLVIRPPRRARVRVLQDGELIADLLADEARLGLQTEGAYRVEVWDDEDLWIVAGPIYITEANKDEGP